VLLLALPFSYAAIYMVEPKDIRLSANEEAFLGKAAVGETVKIVIKKKNDSQLEWNQLSVNQLLLPQYWETETQETDKTLIAFVKIPANATVSTQRLQLAASNSSLPSAGESFFATVAVNESLLSVSIEKLNQGTILGSPASFDLVLNNDSIAEHSLLVESTLPDYWFRQETIVLLPLEKRTVELPVMPYSYGEKNFSFIVSSMHNSRQFAFAEKIGVKPTLLGVYSAPSAGFAFFSPALIPYYLINALLSLIA